jgi:hypothetical protein
MTGLRTSTAMSLNCLKAVICATLRIEDYPDKGTRLREALKTHDFDDLKLLAGMEMEFNLDPMRFAYWSTAGKWRPEQGYEAEG